METDMLALLNKYRKPLMGFAALCIYMNHATAYMFSGYLIAPIEKFIVTTAFYCVDLFLFLAGIGQVFSIKKNSLKDFYVHRVKRLIFPFVLAGLLKLLAFYLNWGEESLNHYYRWTLGEFVKGVSGYSFVTENVCIHLWFIPAIIIFSAFFPLYYKIFSKFKNKYLFTGVVLIIWLAVSMLVLNKYMRQDIFALTNRIPVFVLGVLAGDLSYNKVQIKKTPLRIVELFIIWLIGIAAFYITQFRDVFVLVKLSNCFGPTLCRAISVAFLLPWAFDAFMRNKQVTNISSIVNKILIFYGKITLEIYAIQEFLVYIVLNDFLGYECNTAIVNILTLIVVTACAVAVYFVNNFVQKGIEKLFRCGKPKEIKTAKN